MENSWQRLQNEVVSDHREIIRGYLKLIELLKHGEFAEAASFAGEPSGMV